MEVIKQYIGSYMDSSIFLNNGKYGWYLNHNNKLYGVPKCFQKPKFKLDDAIKIIKFKKKMKEQQIENRKDFKEEEDIIKHLDKMPEGATEDDLVEIVKKVKSKKKSK